MHHQIHLRAKIVERRLTVIARLLGWDLVTKQDGDELYWTEAAAPPKLGLRAIGEPTIT